MVSPEAGVCSLQGCTTVQAMREIFRYFCILDISCQCSAYNKHSLVVVLRCLVYAVTLNVKDAHVHCCDKCWLMNVSLDLVTSVHFLLHVQ